MLNGFNGKGKTIRWVASLTLIGLVLVVGAGAAVAQGNNNGRAGMATSQSVGVTGSGGQTGSGLNRNNSLPFNNPGIIRQRYAARNRNAAVFMQPEVDPAGHDIMDGRASAGPGEVTVNNVYNWPVVIPTATSPVATKRDEGIMKNQLKTFGYPLSDTQFQMIQRYNQNIMLEQMFDPEKVMWLMASTGNMQMQNTADSAANLERNQAASAIDFSGSYLYNFTVQQGNKWNKIRDQLFIPMAILILLPGAVLAQVKAIVAAGTPVIADVQSPFEGVLRSIVAVFLIPATYLVINYGIDVANSITYTIASEYKRIFGSDMYKDALCLHVRAHPIRQAHENDNGIFREPTLWDPLLPGEGTPAKVMEGQTTSNLLEDPCAGERILPPERTNEAASFLSTTQRVMTGVSNAGLAATWNILCAFQMAYLYYLWCVGPVVAALWVWPAKQLREALPSWTEGVITLCFWSLFWNTVILLMACFRGVDDTGSVLTSALLFLANAAVKHAFDFAGLVKAAGQQAAGQALGQAGKAGQASGAGAGSQGRSSGSQPSAPHVGSSQAGHALGGTSDSGGSLSTHSAGQEGGQYAAQAHALSAQQHGALVGLGGDSASAAGADHVAAAMHGSHGGHFAFEASAGGGSFESGGHVSGPPLSDSGAGAQAETPYGFYGAADADGLPPLAYAGGTGSVVGADYFSTDLGDTHVSLGGSSQSTFGGNALHAAFNNHSWQSFQSMHAAHMAAHGLGHGAHAHGGAQAIHGAQPLGAQAIHGAQPLGAQPLGTQAIHGAQPLGAQGDHGHHGHHAQHGDGHHRFDSREVAAMALAAREAMSNPALNTYLNSPSIDQNFSFSVSALSDANSNLNAALQAAAQNNPDIARYSMGDGTFDFSAMLAGDAIDLDEDIDVQIAATDMNVAYSQSMSYARDLADQQAMQAFQTQQQYQQAVAAEVQRHQDQIMNALMAGTAPGQQQAIQQEMERVQQNQRDAIMSAVAAQSVQNSQWAREAVNQAQSPMTYEQREQFRQQKEAEWQQRQQQQARELQQLMQQQAQQVQQWVSNQQQQDVINQAQQNMSGAVSQLVSNQNSQIFADVQQQLSRIAADAAQAANITAIGQTSQAAAAGVSAAGSGPGSVSGTSTTVDASTTSQYSQQHGTNFGGTVYGGTDVTYSSSGYVDGGSYYSSSSSYSYDEYGNVYNDNAMQMNNTVGNPAASQSFDSSQASPPAIAGSGAVHNATYSQASYQQGAEQVVNQAANQQAQAHEIVNQATGQVQQEVQRNLEQRAAETQAGINAGYVQPVQYTQGSGQYTDASTQYAQRSGQFSQEPSSIIDSVAQNIQQNIAAQPMAPGGHQVEQMARDVTAFSAAGGAALGMTQALTGGGHSTNVNYVQHHGGMSPTGEPLQQQRVVDIRGQQLARNSYSILDGPVSGLSSRDTSPGQDRVNPATGQKRFALRSPAVGPVSGMRFRGAASTGPAARPPQGASGNAFSRALGSSMRTGGARQLGRSSAGGAQFKRVCDPFGEVHLASLRNRSRSRDKEAERQDLEDFAEDMQWDI